MSSYIIAGSADSIDTAYVVKEWFSASNWPEELRLNIKTLISELSSSIRLNGRNIYNKYAEYMDSLRNQIQLCILSTVK